MWAGERMGRNSVVGGSGSSSFTGRAPNAQMIGALVHRQSKKKKLWVSPSVGDVWLPALALIYLEELILATRVSAIASVSVAWRSGFC